MTACELIFNISVKVAENQARSSPVFNPASALYFFAAAGRLCQSLIAIQKIMMAAGMKKTDHVASTSLPPTVTSVAKIFCSRP
jgi:hypothetical protein